MDVTTSEIPREIADIIVDLNIIGHIPTNHKLNTLSKTYVDADSLVDALFRMIKGETGDTTVDFINTTIDRAIEVSRKYPSWIEHIANYVSELSNALLNLEQIYQRKKQEPTVSKIKLIKLRIVKDRFMRACQMPKTSASIPIPITLSQDIGKSSSMSPNLQVGSAPMSVKSQLSRTAPGALHHPDPRKENPESK